jgi:hypothetical protein
MQRSRGRLAEVLRDTTALPAVQLLWRALPVIPASPNSGHWFSDRADPTCYAHRRLWNLPSYPSAVRLTFTGFFPPKLGHTAKIGCAAPSDRPPIVPLDLAASRVCSRQLNDLFNIQSGLRVLFLPARASKLIRRT